MSKLLSGLRRLISANNTLRETDAVLPEAVPEPPDDHPVWSSSVRYIALVSLLLMLLYGCYILRGSLTLIVLAALAAYLLNPVVRFLYVKLHLKRGLAITLSYLMLVILVIVAGSFIIPWLTQAIRNFFAIDWPQVLLAIENYAVSLESEIEISEFSVGGFSIDITKPLESFIDWIHSLSSESIDIQSLIPDITAVARQVFSFSTNMFSQILTAFIMSITTIMASVYFCRDGHKLSGILIGVFEEKYQPEIRELLRRLKTVWSSYFIGELKLMFYIGIITTVVYLVMGMRWALLLGLIAGFCEVVPNIGPILAVVPAVISALIFGSSWIPLNHFIIAILSVVVAVIIQQTENIFLVPHIMGNALELHPVIILIGIITLSSRMGVLGAVFAAPMIALVKEVLFFIIRKIKLQDPYPEIYLKKS